MIRRLAGCLFATASLFATAEMARACVLLPVVTVGEVRQPTARELARQTATVQARRVAAARTDLRTGKLDASTGIADMVIPNVRAVVIGIDSCGVSDEYDQAGRLRLEDARDVFDNTELEGLDPERFVAFFRNEVTAYQRDCNVQFRSRFASLLRTKARPTRLADDYVTLATARPSPTIRYFDFASDRREPPVKLNAFATSPGVAQILGDAKHPINQAMALFWHTEAPRLGSDEQVCPHARRTFLRARDAQIEEWRNGHQFARLQVDAARGRTLRQARDATGRKDQ